MLVKFTIFVSISQNEARRQLSTSLPTGTNIGGSGDDIYGRGNLLPRDEDISKDHPRRTVPSENSVIVDDLNNDAVHPTSVSSNYILGFIFTIQLFTRFMSHNIIAVIVSI